MAEYIWLTQERMKEREDIVCCYQSHIWNNLHQASGLFLGASFDNLTTKLQSPSVLTLHISNERKPLVQSTRSAEVMPTV